MTQSAPAIAATAPDADAFVAPPYQDINTRRAPWPRLIQSRRKTPGLWLSGEAGEISLAGWDPETELEHYDYDIYRLAAQVRLTFGHWREETRTGPGGTAQRVAVFERLSGDGPLVAFEAEMPGDHTPHHAPRYALTDRQSGVRINVSAHVTGIAPRAHGRNRPSVITLTFARRAEYLLAAPAYGHQPGTVLTLWFGSLL
ncbi:hypothetical protein [Pannonibacter tanglangensis]|uniref:Uncharacterized protein n=1 Tax=Pannonibacter tanglangensis TaxID=2750084 RepID=A0ABW9ZN56_9HYPH|nr:hypothetical protein [Pannonibacter sp. XCT-34]NBN64170.1 hypothetical protein [Pannonibacter sp. XCT-34]